MSNFAVDDGVAVCVAAAAAAAVTVVGSTANLRRHFWERKLCWIQQSPKDCSLTGEHESMNESIIERKKE